MPLSLSLSPLAFCLFSTSNSLQLHLPVPSPLLFSLPEARATMLTLVAGGVVFPGLFLLSKNTLQRLPQLRWEEADAVIVSAR